MGKLGQITLLSGILLLIGVAVFIFIMMNKYTVIGSKLYDNKYMENNNLHPAELIH